MITHERVREALDYEPETGVFRWLIRPWSSKVHPGDVAGSPRGNGYWQIKLDRHNRGAHIWAWFWMTGEWPATDIDHIDGNGLNNRWDNLRLRTRAENMWNAVLPQRNNVSGWRGVSLDRSTGRWAAKIQVNGKVHWLGRFDTPEAASAAYWAAKAELHGEETYSVRLERA